MVQGYYSLEEAARILQMAAEELSQMAQRREVRAFADRGTWRFRTQDIEELARRRGLGSNPELQLSDSSTATPPPGPKFSELPTGSLPEGFSLSTAPTAPLPKIAPGGPSLSGLAAPESEQVEIGKAPASETPSSGRKSGGPTTPKPSPGSDSDVRLVADGSDVGLKATPAPTPAGGPGSSARRKAAAAKQDSGAKLVPMEGESDSDVKIVPDSADDVDLGAKPPKSGSDSDIRLESPSGARKASTARADDSFMTDEIDLDAELQKAEESAILKGKFSDKSGQPKSAPFELSEADLGTAKAKPKAGDSMSDFDLALNQDDLSLELSSAEFELAGALGNDDRTLAMPPVKKDGSGDSGINLKDPADAGISLEQKKKDSDDSIDFELSLDSGGSKATPKPAKAEPGEDSSSEFELTLEDSAKLAPLEDDASKDDKDVFETDFEVPALEESDSQLAPLEDSDTDLESSDFDLALSDEDMVTEEESASQVVALEDEADADEGAATVAKKSDKRKSTKVRPADDEEEADDFTAAAEDEDDDYPAGSRRTVAAAAPADWGTLAPSMLLASLFLMFIIFLMSFELVRGMWGYRQPNSASALMIKAIAGMFMDAKDLPE